MSNRLIFSKCLWGLCFLAIIAGFMFQSWGVSREYFEYQTSPFVVIQDYPEKEVTVPTVVMCIRFNIDPSIESKVGKLFTGDRNYFKDKNDSWKLLKGTARLPPGERLIHLTKKYILRNKYCLFVKALNRFSMEDVMSSRYLSQTYFYRFNLSMDPVHSPNAFQKYESKHCSPKEIYFQIVSGEEAISNPRNRFAVKLMCTRIAENYKVDLTYSSSINVRLPPPFDTNCFDYRKEGQFLSSHDCFDKCLKHKTIQWNIVPGMTVIDREEFKQSTLDIAPGDIIEDKENLDKLLKKKSLPEKLLDTYRILQTNWKEIKESCRQLCNRHDCTSERITPVINFIDAGITKGNETLLTHAYYRLMVAEQPVVHVSSVPRQKLIDYIVYMCSLLSFWLGLCPLNVINDIYNRLRHCPKRRKKQGLSRTLERLAEYKEYKERVVTRCKLRAEGNESTYRIHRSPYKSPSLDWQILRQCNYNDRS